VHTFPGTVLYVLDSLGYNIFLSLFQIADKLEVFPGAEFRVAFEEARSYGAKIILGDRPLQVRCSCYFVL